MISGYEKLQLIDMNGRKTGMIIEVNWNPKDEATNKCQILKVTFPDGKSVFIKKDIFMTFLFMLGTEKEQQDIVPQQLRTIRKYKTMIGVVAKKDIRKGEKVNFEVEIPLPDIEQEIIGEAKRQASKSINGLPIIGKS